jgi:hypothetical protein
VITGKTDKIESLEQLYQRKGILENGQVISILQEQNKCDFYRGVVALLRDIKNPYGKFPLGWARPIRTRCKQPITDLIYALNNYAEVGVRRAIFVCEKWRTVR